MAPDEVAIEFSLQKIERTELQPGDLLVLTTRMFLKDEEIDRLNKNPEIEQIRIDLEALEKTITDAFTQFMEKLPTYVYISDVDVAMLDVSTLGNPNQAIFEVKIELGVRA